jgi:hypothetical protein
VEFVALVSFTKRCQQCDNVFISEFPAVVFKKVSRAFTTREREREVDGATVTHSYFPEAIQELPLLFKNVSHSSSETVLTYKFHFQERLSLLVAQNVAEIVIEFRAERNVICQFIPQFGQAGSRFISK